MEKGAQPYNRNDDRLKVLWFFGTVSLVTAPLFVYAYGALGYPLASAAVLFSIPFLLLTYLILRVFRTPAIAGNWIIFVGFTLFGYLAYTMGGIHAPSITWSVGIPIVATLICGPRSGIFWLVLVLAQFSFFHLTGLHEHDGLPHGQVLLHQAIYVNLMGVACFLFLLALVSESIKTGYLVRIEKSNADLKEALGNIKTLRGLLPICAWCKRIRNDGGYWDRLETYFTAHTQAEFSHGVCPECEAKLSEELKKKKAE